MSASNSEDVTTLIRRSLERELGLLEMKKRLTQEEIKEFEHQCGMDSTEFIKRQENLAILKTALSGGVC